MQYFPLFVDTKNLKVLVVGAGEVAARKLTLLTRTEANITVVAETICGEITELAAQKSVALKEKSVEPADLDGVQVLYMATEDYEINQKYAVLARQREIWVNVVDSPADCSFITPAMVDRGKLQIAISSSGAAPVLAGLIRTQIETWLPQSTSKLMNFAAESRGLLKQKLPAGISLRQFWYRFFKTNGFGYNENVQNLFDEMLKNNNSSENHSVSSQIYFINSTRQISKLPISVLPILQQVDAVLYEKEVPADLNELIRRDAARAKVNPNVHTSMEYEGVTLIFASRCTLKNVTELK